MKRYKVTLPEPPENCQQCGRKLDGRMFDNPFGMWSTPVLDGATRRTLCSYCHDVQSGRDPKVTLPAGCKALEYLERWLAQPSKNVQ